MEIEALKALSEKLLSHGVAMLQRGSDLMPLYNLVRSDGELEIMGIDGQIMNDRKAKRDPEIQAEDGDHRYDGRMFRYFKRAAKGAAH